MHSTKIHTGDRSYDSRPAKTPTRSNKQKLRQPDKSATKLNRRSNSRIRDISKGRDANRLRNKSSTRDVNKAKDRSRLRDRSKDEASRKVSKFDNSNKKNKPIRSSRAESYNLNEIRKSVKDESCEHIRSRKKSPNKSRLKKSKQRNHSSECSNDDISCCRRSSQDSSTDLQQDSLEGSWNKTRSFEKRTERQDSAGESQYSSWSSEGTYEKSFYEKIDNPGRKGRNRSKANSPRRLPTKASSPVRQPSPIRRPSPPQDRKKSPSRQKSPTRRRDEVRRRDSWAGQFDKPGLLLTAEQLKNQKQRLRPVRPSALPDITDLPEKSLQDLTMLLRHAMNRRRDYFPRSMQSDDPFSDWK